jgi:hypothetical protein
VYASGTRAILREGARRHDEWLKEASRRHEELLRAHERGATQAAAGSGWIETALARLPAPVQTSLLLTMALFLYQLLGMMFVGITGGTLPQLKVPPIVVSEVPTTPTSIAPTE